METENVSTAEMAAETVVAEPAPESDAAEHAPLDQTEPDGAVSQEEPLKAEEPAGTETREDEAEPDSSLSQREPIKSPLLAKGGSAEGAAAGGSAAEEAGHPLQEAERSKAREDEEELLRYYPGFNVATDGVDPTFRAMVSAGVPMRRAYEALHLEDLISGAMAYASRRTLERLAGAALAGQQRPEENGLRTGQPAAPVFDPRALTKEQARDLKERVFRGEKIYL